jgi:hypothetical protein
MERKFLAVALPEDLYHKFIETFTDKDQLRRDRETFTEALESAVAAALRKFLESIEEKIDFPEFREYIHQKYPELDEDLITMIEDLISKEKQRTRGNH